MPIPAQRVSIMTLHAAKGLEFETVYLPGWEEGLFPHQRSLDEQGRAGLEEERRLAYVGLTRAKRRAKIYFATNRRIHGLWQTTMPSRFLDESAGGACRSGRGGDGARIWRLCAIALRQYGHLWLVLFDAGLEARASGAARRHAQGSARAVFKTAGRGAAAADRRRSSSRVRARGSAFAKGARVFHMKFGPGTVAAVDGNKLTIDFDKAGRKMVLESFVRARIDLQNGHSPSLPSRALSPS